MLGLLADHQADVYVFTIILIAYVNELSCSCVSWVLISTSIKRFLTLTLMAVDHWWTVVHSENRCLTLLNAYFRIYQQRMKEVTQ